MQHAEQCGQGVGLVGWGRWTRASPPAGLWKEKRPLAQEVVPLQPRLSPAGLLRIQVLCGVLVRLAPGRAQGST